MEFIDAGMLGNGEDIRVHPISDLHIGSAEFREKEFKARVNSIVKDKNAYVLLGGDMINNALKDSKSNVYADIMSPSEQVKHAVKLLSPIKDRILCYIGGNHERRSIRSCDIDPSQYITDMLGVNYYEPEALVKIKVGCNSHGRPYIYKLYITHGTGGGRSMGGKSNSLDRLASIIHADAYICGHTHQPIIFKKPYLVPDDRTNKIKNVIRTFVNSGCWVGREAYAAQMGFPEPYIGAPTMILSGDCQNIEAVL